MGTRLYIKNLGYDETSSDLATLLSPYGSVQSAEVIKGSRTGRSKRFGFVEMASEQEAQNAIDRLNGQQHNGRNLIVALARPRVQKKPGNHNAGKPPRHLKGGIRSSGMEAGPKPRSWDDYGKTGQWW